ncbi:MAG: hypothetical protein Faunusvirus63_4 [Faunusvirus sp.]|uniref:Uncharacterized protein n=1 Tax=Faunusvirus sp. TaxID=2487766 RepID=A0A3G4ZY51_9VIRU|nr:MAG: hypothetical protein Faunusvirus63_4 [Faunusvirus sp.]
MPKKTSAPQKVQDANKSKKAAAKVAPKGGAKPVVVASKGTGVKADEYRPS